MQEQSLSNIMFPASAWIDNQKRAGRLRWGYVVDLLLSMGKALGSTPSTVGITQL